MLSVLNWALFIFLVLIALIFYLSFWVIMEDNNGHNEPGLLIFLSGLMSLFLIVPMRFLFNSAIAVYIWKIMAFIIMASLVLSLCLSRYKTYRKSLLRSAPFTLSITVLPFVYNLSIDIDEANVILISNHLVLTNEVLILFLCLGIIVLPLLSMISLFRFRKRLDVILNNQRHNLELEAMWPNSSFRKPYEGKLREDLVNMLQLFEHRITNIIRSNFPESATRVDPSSSNKEEMQIFKEQLDEMKKMITSLSPESGKQTIDFDLVRDLNHAFATPFATIEMNAELLKSSKDINMTYLERISDSIQLCKAIIETYRKMKTLSEDSDSSKQTFSLKRAVAGAFNSNPETSKKHLNLTGLESIPDSFLSHDNYFIVTAMLPLIENSIHAAKNDSSLVVNFSSENRTIVIKNECDNPPVIDDLNTPGYSTKKDHKGLGISIAKNLLSLGNRGNLYFSLEGKKTVIQTIKFN